MCVYLSAWLAGCLCKRLGKLLPCVLPYKCQETPAHTDAKHIISTSLFLKSSFFLSLWESKWCYIDSSPGETPHTLTSNCITNWLHVSSTKALNHKMIGLVCYMWPDNAKLNMPTPPNPITAHICNSIWGFSGVEESNAGEPEQSKGVSLGGTRYFWKHHHHHHHH